MILTLKNEIDKSNAEYDIGMLIQIVAVDRQNGTLIIETESSEWTGPFKGLSVHHWKKEEQKGSYE